MSPSVLSPPCLLIMSNFLDIDPMLGTVFGAISSYPTFQTHSRRIFSSKENGNNEERKAVLGSVKFCRTDWKCSERSEEGAVRWSASLRGLREPCGKHRQRQITFGAPSGPRRTLFTSRNALIKCCFLALLYSRKQT